MRTRHAIATASVALVAAFLPALSGVAGLPAIGAAAYAQAVASDVRITVTIGADRTADVLESYRVPQDTASRVFRLLTRPCAVPGDIRFFARAGSATSATGAAGATVGVVGSADAGVVLARRMQGPWLELASARSPDQGDSPDFSVRYRVSLARTSVDIPLVHLAKPIARTSGDRAGSVSVAVDLSAVPAAAVTFPLFERHGSGVWRARFVAIPSFVHVELPGTGTNAPCIDTQAASHDDGGLTWRFWLFAGIMAAWVPLYLAWARRSGESGA